MNIEDDIDHNTKYRCNRCCKSDLRQAGIRLDTHIIGQRQADKQGLDQSLYHNPQRLVMSIEISDHAKQHRCYDGLQCEAPADNHILSEQRFYQL